jgi:hypothetical protein
LIAEPLAFSTGTEPIGLASPLEISVSARARVSDMSVAPVSSSIFTKRDPSCTVACAIFPSVTMMGMLSSPEESTGGAVVIVVVIGGAVVTCGVSARHSA